MAKHDNRKKGYGVSGVVGDSKSNINKYAKWVKDTERFKELCGEITISWTEPIGIKRPHLNRKGKPINKKSKPNK